MPAPCTPPKQTTVEFGTTATSRGEVWRETDCLSGSHPRGRQEQHGPQGPPPADSAAAPSGAVTLPSPTCAINGLRDMMVWIPLLRKLKIPPPLCHQKPAGKAIPEGGWGGQGTQLNARRLLGWTATDREGVLPGDSSCTTLQGHLASRLGFLNWSTADLQYYAQHSDPVFLQMIL